MSLFIVDFAAAELEPMRFLPPPPPLGENIIVIDRDKAKGLDRLSLTVLQGLVNRSSASVYLLDGNLDSGTQDWWLAQYKSIGLITCPIRETTPDEFLNKYYTYAKGVIIPPENLGDRGAHIAIMHAALSDALVGSKELANRLKLPILEDYSNRFADYSEAFQYALTELLPRLNKSAIIFSDSYRLADYAVQHSLFYCTWWNQDKKEAGLLRQLLLATPPNIPIIGRGGKGTSEGTRVSFFSSYGKCLFWAEQYNMSLHSALPRPKGAELSPNLRTPRVLDRGKVYLTIRLSDGDNVNTWFSSMQKNGSWNLRGKLPLSWGMGAALLELCPGLVRYYYSTKTQLDEFYSCVSAGSYMFPGDFAMADEFEPWEREHIWEQYLDRAEKLRKELQQSVIHISHYENCGDRLVDNQIFRRFVRAMPNALGIFNGGYGRIASAYGELGRVVEGMPILHCVTDQSVSDSPIGLANDLRNQTPDIRPAFLTVWANAQRLYKDFDYIRSQLSSLQSERYEIVLPSEFFELYRQAYGLPTNTPFPSNQPTHTPTNTVTPASTRTRTPIPSPTIQGSVLQKICNPSFEQGIDSWQISGKGHATMGEYSIFPFEGKYMFGWTNSRTGANSEGILWQKVKGLKIGQTYRLSCQIYTRWTDESEQMPSDNIYAEFIYRADSNLPFKSISPRLYHDSEWRLFGAEFIAEKEDIELGLRLVQQQAAYWNHIYTDVFILESVNNKFIPAKEGIQKF